MTKKLVALVMALMMLLSVTALAETADTSDWETYRFEDAQLTISCPADMAALLPPLRTAPCPWRCIASIPKARPLRMRRLKWKPRRAISARPIR